VEDSSHYVDSKRIVIDGDTMDVVDLTSKKKKKKVRSIPLELQRLFSQLQLLDELSVGTEGFLYYNMKALISYWFNKKSALPVLFIDLTNKGFQWQDMEGAVQHDAHELNR